MFSAADSEAASVVVSSAAVVVSSAEEAAAVVSVVDYEQPARRDPAIASAIMTDNIFLIYLVPPEKNLTDTGLVPLSA